MKNIFLLFLIISFYSVLYSQAPKKVVLCEIMTSTTCPPCASANPYFDNWLKTYPERNKVAVIKYHTWWPSPGNDPFYFADTFNNRTRVNYYQPGSKYVPRANVDGEDRQDSPTNWINGITSKINSSTPISISIKNPIDSTGLKSDIEIKVTAEDVTLPVGTKVLHVAIVESNIKYTGPNGDPNHDFVMRKMYPNALGEEFILSSGETLTFTRSIFWNTQWKFYNSKLVVFVQIKESRQVLNSVMIDLNQIPSSFKEENVNIKNYSLSQNYPNPFNPSTTINYEIPANQSQNNKTTIKIYNVLGNELETLVDEYQTQGKYSIKWDASKYPSGIYFYEMKSGKFKDMKKMILIK